MNIKWNIPLHGFTTTYLSICPLMDIRVFSIYWLLRTMQLLTFMYNSLSMFSFLFDTYPGVDLLGLVPTLNYGRNRRLFSQLAVTSPPMVCEDSNFSIFPATLGAVWLFTFTFQQRGEQYLRPGKQEPPPPCKQKTSVPLPWGKQHDLNEKGQGFGIKQTEVQIPSLPLQTYCGLEQLT